jgi:hypothetical protein
MFRRDLPSLAEIPCPSKNGKRNHSSDHGDPASPGLLTHTRHHASDNVEADAERQYDIGRDRYNQAVDSIVMRSIREDEIQHHQARHDSKAW